MNDQVTLMWAKALEKREAARELFALGYWSDSLSRSYYAAFHAVTLLFFLEGKSFSSHAHLKGNFHKDCIHTGRLCKETGVSLEYLFECRQTGDYDVLVSFDREEAQQGLDAMDQILHAIRNLITSNYKLALDPFQP